jgi:16S rRNA (guanine527-N7)-methyltransferase
MSALLSRLEKGLKTLDLEVSSEHQQQLISYLMLMEKWNQAYNLTAIQQLDEMIPRHLIDSLSIAPYLQGEHFIDVGTGPGLPGLPLAVVFPQRKFVLLDSNGKRTRFLLQVKNNLGLANVEIVKARVESYSADKLFDGILSRAFSSLTEMLVSTKHLCAKNGRFYAMKGLYPEKELRDLPKGFNVEACHRLSVSGLEAERHLVLIQADSSF